MKILVVEDKEIHRESALYSLQEMGHEVNIAGDMKDACRKFGGMNALCERGRPA